MIDRTQVVANRKAAAAAARPAQRKLGNYQMQAPADRMAVVAARRASAK